MDKPVITYQTSEKSLDEKTEEKANAAALGLPVVEGKQALGYCTISLSTGQSLTTFNLEDGTQIKIDEAGEKVLLSQDIIYPRIEAAEEEGQV